LHVPIRSTRILGSLEVARESRLDVIRAAPNLLNRDIENRNRQVS